MILNTNDRTIYSSEQLPSPTSRPEATQYYDLVDDVALDAEPDPRWLIEKVLPAENLGVVYGLPGSAKSFLALDWGLSIATGQPWLGHEVERGDVVYVAAEGARGYKKRVRAWKEANNWSGRAGMHFLKEPLPLTDITAVQRLLGTLSHKGITPKLIVLDTLARCFSGDDNSAREMSQVIAAVDTIRLATDATILLIHHSRKNDTSFRGSGALEGAVDMMTHVQMSGTSVTVRCQKMKEAEPFRLPTLNLVTLSDSCVLESSGSTAPASVPLLEKENHRATLDALPVGGATHKEWLTLASAVGVPSGSFGRIRSQLIQAGMIVREGRTYRPAADRIAYEEASRSDDLSE
jgi:hypothetical protein